MDLREVLSRNELFAGVSEAALDAFAAHAREIHVAAAAAVIQEGDRVEAIFLVVSGRLQVEIAVDQGVVVAAEIEPGETVGAMAMLTGEPSSGTVVAQEPSHLITVSRSSFQNLLKNYSADVARVLTRVLELVERRQLSMALHHNALFASLPAPVLRDLGLELKAKFLAGGETLFRQGEQGDQLYLVISGRLRIVREVGESPGVLGEIGSGEIVGEVAIIGGQTRLATVVAVRDTHLASLSRAGFQKILARHPLIMAPFFTSQLVAIATQPTQQRNSRANVRSIALAAVTPGVDLHRFTQNLAAAMPAGMRVLHLTRGTVNQALGADTSQMLDWDPRHANLLLWLNDKERHYDCVLYEADASDPPWTNRCLRQADRILLVAEADAPQSGTPPLPHLSEKGKPLISLALLHAEGKEPSNTAAWLQRHQVDHHHHLHWSSQEDFARVARYLTGRTIGLALGGGFARGLAHIGVVRALRELNLPIDAIGGTSMGAFVALEYIWGYGFEEMVDHTCEGGTRALHDWTLPLVALFHGKKVRRSVIGHTQGRNLEDFWIPYFAVATNLTKASIEVLREGPAEEALLASSRVPGMFPPIVRGEDLLVDGGLASNVPADVMKPFCGGSVIAVDVSGKIDFTAYRSQHSDVSGWKVLVNRMRSAGKIEPAPNILAVLMRCMQLESESYRERMRSFSDLYLTPPVRHYRFNDFKRGRQIAEEAYRYARPELERWLSQCRTSDSHPAPAATATV